MSGPMYFTDNGRDVPPYHFSNGRELDSNDTYLIEGANILQSQAQLQQFSPFQRYRHDSLLSCSESSGAKSSNTSPHQAEAQPCLNAAKVTTQGFKMRPVNMERTASQFSSSSGGQQYHDQHRASFAQTSASNAAGMSRPPTRCSNLSTGYQTQLTAPPQPRLAHMHTSPGTEHTSVTSLATCTVPLSPTNSAGSVYTFGMEEMRSIRSADVSGMGELFGHSATYDESLYFRHESSAGDRSRDQSLGQQIHIDEKQPLQSPLADKISPTTSRAAISPRRRSPPLHSLSPLLPAPKRRRRRSSLATDSRLDPIIGSVTASGKFKCCQPNCHDISFGRQADFRRHYDHTHVSKKLEVYCTVEGCTRSRFPTGKSKGKSFGSRDDKMKEHFRTVHLKKVKNADTLETTSENVEQEGISEEDDHEMQLTSNDGSFRNYEQIVGPINRTGYEGYLRPFYSGHDLAG